MTEGTWLPGQNPLIQALLGTGGVVKDPEWWRNFLLAHYLPKMFRNHLAQRQAEEEILEWIDANQIEWRSQDDPQVNAGLAELLERHSVFEPDPGLEPRSVTRERENMADYTKPGEIVPGSGEELLGLLRAATAGGINNKKITGDEVQFHDGPQIVLPRGMTYGKAYKILQRLEEEAEMPTRFDRKFLFRADDGAYATLQCIKDRWGMALGKLTETFFGTIPAEQRDIAIDVDTRIQVPWGRIEIPTMPGLEMYLGEMVDRDYGKIFQITAVGPRKYKEEMEVFYDEIDRYLERHSIYRGHAIIGSDNPEFLNLRDFDARKIVFSDEVTELLDGTIHAPIRYAEAMRANDVPLKKAVLLEGPYGTGKTSEGMIVAEIAVENSWTFISAKPGRDKIEDVMRTARLYQPAVVFIEDIDGSTSSGEAEDVTKMLDAFDGITAKGGEIIVVLTTNHIERIHKGMLRPGRLDAVINIAALDEGGVKRLIEAVVDPVKLDSKIDYHAVGESMRGFLPAFVKEAINRAVTFAINRLEGHGNYTIGTHDLVLAAESLRPQLNLQDAAGEGVRKPALETALGEAVQASIKELVFQGGRDALRPRDLTDEEREMEEAAKR